MLKNFQYKSWVLVVFFGLLFVIITAITDNKHNGRVCNAILISIDNENGNYFLDKETITSLMTEKGKYNLIGEKYKNIDAKVLENRIKSNIFVRFCEVSKNLKGEVFVSIKQVNPVARFENKLKSFYINNEGKIFAVSNTFSARVLLITSDKEVVLPDFVNDETDQNLLLLVQFINKNAFWKAEIAQIHVNKENEILLYLQVGNQEISLGKLENQEDIDKKMNKLDIVCKKILTTKGWNTYKKISLKYSNQIICQ